MEQKSISFGFGIQRSPSLAIQSGELSEAVNLIPKNGELVNIKPPVILDDIKSTGTFRYVHNTSGDGSHYIFTKAVTADEVTTYSVYYLVTGDSSAEHEIEASLSSNVKEFTAMGNFLIANTDEGIVYYLWKNTTEGYQVLRGRPDLHFFFQLSGSFRWRNYTSCVDGANIKGGSAASEYTNPLKALDYSGTTGYHSYFFKTDELTNTVGLTTGEHFVIENNLPFDIKITNSNDAACNETIAVGEKSEVHNVGAKGNLTIVWTASGDYSGNIIFYTCSSGDKTDETIIVANTQANYEAIFGSLSEFTQNFEAVGKKFVRPFLVRYGFRMYDGSVLFQSCPMLMIPNNGISPAITMTSIDTNDKSSLQISAFIADLGIKPYSLNSSISDEIDKWKDIIVGVVVAVSQPIDIYKTDYVRNENYNDIEFWKYDVNRMTDIYGILEGTKVLLSAINDFHYQANPQHIVRPPYLSSAEFGKKVYNTSEFYVIKEFTPDEIKALATDNFTILDSTMRDAGGSDVATLPSMGDDYGSLANIYPSHILNYNNRFDVANIKYNFASPTGICSPLLTNNALLIWNDSKTRIITYLKINGKEIIDDTGWIAGTYSTRWIFYPNKKAYKYLIFLYKDSTGSYYKLSGTLQEHKILNGAYSYSAEEVNFEDATEAEATADYTPTDNTIASKNAIYVSEAANPLYLPLTNTKSVGSGEIYAVSTSAKALSSGTQFGTFPLYAFCSDGVWPLSVASDGTFDAPNPLSRDVLYHKDSVTGEVCQVDSAVAFPTEAGLKVVQGQEVVKASGSMEGYNTDETQFFKDKDGNLNPLAVVETDSIVKILCNAYLLHDYANSLIHAYPKDPKYNDAGNYKHYVFSLQQSTWSTMVDTYGNVKAVVPGYPFSYIQCAADGQVMIYNSEEKNDVPRAGVILTRPIAFDAPMSLKVLADLKIIYSSGGQASCKVQPYVSNDGVNWYKLTSLRSRAFKWFRFRINTSLTDLDTLTALECLIEERRNNKLR